MRDSVIQKRTRGVSFVLVNGKVLTVRDGQRIAVKIDPRKMQSRANRVVSLKPAAEAQSPPKRQMPVAPAPAIEPAPIPETAVAAPEAEPLDVEELGAIGMEEQRRKTGKHRKRSKDYEEHTADEL